ncbi:transporter substrate-binding domain-containing protein [Changpingibacter yushuensis]|uniref:transporter substrate-binding domain-containing protein n=1 Tax=Changpingibacter yushuensis TaxID=2758440 RepID=UPI00165E806F|nr:transporter substrate-binding domain-containing protein [Changpingibacter yushuensis]
MSRSSRTNRFVAIGATLIASALALSGCSSDSSADSASSSDDAAGHTVEEIQSAGTVRLGVFTDKAPFGSVDSDGNYVGYDIEYGERIAKDLGVEIEWVPVDASARVEYLQSDKVDVILANFTVTDERAGQVDFADPYLQVSLGVASPVGSEITDESQLADANIIVVKGTTAETYVDENYPDANVTKYEQYTEATNALIDGRGDAWVTDNTEALAWTGSHDGFATGITKLGTPDTIAAAVQKGNSSLLAWLNDELVTLNDEGFFLQDYQDTLLPVYGDDVDPEDLLISNN